MPPADRRVEDVPKRRARRRAPARVAVDVSTNGQRVAVAAAELGGLAAFVLRAEKVRDALVSIALLDARAMARLNREHLGHRGATDVIAFGLRDGPPLVGDVYVCPAVARRNAARFGVSIRDELRRLVVHGTLHVIGWQHADDEARTASPMWRRQEALLIAWQRRVQ